MNRALVFSIIIILVLLFYSTFEFIRLRKLISRSSELVLSSKPFNKSQADPDQNILVVGDSTGVGTGADPDKSLAGRLAADYPKARIINKSVNGLRSTRLVDSLPQYLDSNYDLILIHIGGNDLIRFSSLNRTKQNIKQILNLASTKSKRVVLYTTGNLGEAKFFPSIVRPIYSARSKQLRDDVIALSSQYNNVVYVDLFGGKAQLEAVNRYAIDKLHLNNQGYELWYDKLKGATGGQIIPTN